MIIAFHKPYGVLSQFTREPGSSYRTLAEFGFHPGVYPVGRLDADSEGLLLLSDEKGLPTYLLDPESGHERTYWAQVEGVPTTDAIEAMRTGIIIKDYKTRRCRVEVLDPQPTIEERSPPIRVRQSIPTTWISLTLIEGRNRQVRRMCAHVGFPSLRLRRVSIGSLNLVTSLLASGHWREITSEERALLFKIT